MRLITAAAVVLISASAVAQKPKPTKLYAPPVVASAPATGSSPNTAAQLARIEQQTAHLRSTKPVTHASPTVKATPALDLGKNKPIHASHSPAPTVAHH
jgi:hypothetical protein